jgi:archaeal type IV pilus assembly protein PilA
VKNSTKFKRSLKGISPVIATLLMIAIAVVASLVVYAWVTGYMGNTTSKAGKAIQIQSFASMGGNLVIYVQNVGQGDVELNKDQSVYVNSNLVSITTPATATIPIPVGQTIELQTNSPYTAGTKVTIKVTTTDGTFMTTTGTGPSAGASHGAVTSIAVTPNPASVLAGSTQAFTAMASDGSTSWDVSALATWSVAPVAGGTFAGNTLTAGTANTGYTVTALYSSISGTAPLTVTALVTPHYVDTNAAVHDTNVGTHSNFASMKNVGSYDTLTEADTDSSTGTMGISGTSGSSSTNIQGDDMAGQAFTASGSGRIQSVTFYANSDSTRGNSRNVKVVVTDNSGNILTNGISNEISVSTTAGDKTASFATPPVVQNGQTYWIMIIPDNGLNLYYSSTTGGTSKSDTSNSEYSPTSPTDATSGTINYRRLYASINYDNYQLDQEVQFTGVTNYADYHHLEIQTGAYTGAENIIVQYWTGTAWADLTTNLPANTLTTLSITLSSVTFEIRFKDATTSGDTTQSTWQIDFARLIA